MRKTQVNKLLLVSVFVIVPGIALAQTANPRPKMPVPKTVVNQAKEQNEGNYGTFSRPRTPGQIQKVWNKAKPTSSVYTVDLCEACTYKVRLREFMVTVLELPEGEIIESVDLGDKAGFSAQPRGKNRLALRPKGHGFDTSMVVYGKSGRVYPFYLRAEGFNSKNIPDLVVKIGGTVTIEEDLSVAGFEGVNDKKAISLHVSNAVKAVQGLTNSKLKATEGGDFVAEATFDPNALRGWGRYKLWGDEELKPETVFRDDQFTYIRFGKKWKDIELPTAYVVVDGIDELVNTRIQGQTFIVESTRPLITLKSGQSFLCIEYPGDEE